MLFGHEGRDTKTQRDKVFLTFIFGSSVQFHQAKSFTVQVQAALIALTKAAHPNSGAIVCAPLLKIIP